MVELHGHGGTVVMNLLLQRIVALGARQARPGEFTERAFLNGKLDLAQAEAVADLISASTETAARAASRSLDGCFSRKVESLRQRIIEMRKFVEAAIDFPEEEIDFLAESGIEKDCRSTLEEVNELLGEVTQGRLLRDGLVVVLAGRPNAGKSSLLNALSGRDSAIVTASPGTTRDLVREQIQIDGIPLTVIDTAGLREVSNEVEREGVKRAHEAISSADHMLVVVDCCDRKPVKIPPHSSDTAVTVLHNKIDLTGAAAKQTIDDDGFTHIDLSAKTGQGVDILKRHIHAAAAEGSDAEGSFTARSRHLLALKRVAAHLSDGLHQLCVNRAGELLAEELRSAQQALAEITGVYRSDDLLGEIFSSFCIGK